MRSRFPYQYLVLLMVWAAFVVWQVFEHRRVSSAAVTVEMNRADDIANTLAVVIRSQRRFGAVSRDRLVNALEELAKSHDLQGIALLSPTGDVVASGGQAIPGELSTLKPKMTRRSEHRLVVASQVELGLEKLPTREARPGDPISPTDDAEKLQTAVVWAPEFPNAEGRGDGRGEGRGEGWSDSRGRGDGRPGSVAPGSNSPTNGRPPRNGPGTSHPGEANANVPPGIDATIALPMPAPMLGEGTGAGVGSAESANDRTPPPAHDGGEVQAPGGAGSAAPSSIDEEDRRRNFRRFRESHPFWMTPEKYNEIYEKQGLHLAVLMMDTSQTDLGVDQDLILRLVMGLIALIAAVSAGLSWRSLTRSTELQVRLVKAQSMNTYLRELNLAAAGLAHETRNPLNLVRGMTQLVATQPTTPEKSRQQLETVLDEVDRVTARLNEFIDYSRPREPLLTAVSPLALARDVANTLSTDIEDKAIAFETRGVDVAVLADAGMLRQVLFNLLLNATQAVPHGGRIFVTLNQAADGSQELIVADDGPGVPEEARDDIFRPYFTLNEQGSGLGLAVVRQIALAHSWDLNYLPTTEVGCSFRLSGLTRPSGTATTP